MMVDDLGSTPVTVVVTLVLVVRAGPVLIEVAMAMAGAVPMAPAAILGLRDSAERQPGTGQRDDQCFPNHDPFPRKLKPACCPLREHTKLS